MSMSTMSTPDDEFLAEFDLLDNVQKLTNGQITMGSVIKSLSLVFTSKDVQVRIRSYEILRDIMEQLPPNHLIPDEVTAIGVFLNQRLSHENSAIPVVLQALQTLCQSHNFPDKLAAEVFDIFAKELVVQQQQIVDRFRVYQIVARLIDTKEQALVTELKIDFIIGFIRIIEGERDPRCLLLIFQLFHRVVTNFDLYHMEEDAFEMISCYFPIAYNQPKNDPYNIARSDLATALNTCLASSDKFAQFGMPLIAEKLSADLETARIDSYGALSACCSVYGWGSVKPFMSLVWNHARKDVLRVGDYEPSDLTTAALKCLSSLVIELSNDKETLEYFLNEVVKDIEPGLIKSDLHLRPAAMEISMALMSTSSSFQYMFEKVVRSLLDGSARDTKFDAKFFLLIALERLLESKQNFIKEMSPDEPIQHQSSLVSLCINYLNDATDGQLLNQSLNLLRTIVTVFKCITDNDLESINDHLLEMFIASNNHDRLDKIATIFHELQSDDRLTVSGFLIQLLDKVMTIGNQDVPMDDVRKVLILLKNLKLSAVEKIKIINNVTAAVVDSLKLHQKVMPPKDYHYQIAVQVMNGSVLEEKELTSEENEERSIGIMKKIVDTDLFNLFLDPLVDSLFCSALDLDVFDGAIILYQSFVKQAKKMGLIGRIKNVLIDHDIEFKKLCSCPGGTLDTIRLITVLHPLLIGLDTEDIDDKCLDKLEKLIPFADKADVSILSLMAQIITSLSNKCSKELSPKLVQMVLSRNDESIVQVKLLSALNKGLVTRSQSESKMVTRKLLESIDVLGQETLVADCIIDCHEIGQFEEECLVINPLYHQKLFIDSLPILIDGLKDSTNSTMTAVGKEARRKAILGQLKFLPKNVIKTEVRQIQNLILTSLTDECLDIQLVSIRSLHDLLIDSSNFVANNLSAIVPRLLKAATSCPQLEVRKQSLICLVLIAKIISDVNLLPFRSSTIKGLKPCLADRKRLVRMAAAEASCHWTMVGQAGTG